MQADHSVELRGLLDMRGLTAAYGTSFHSS